MNCCLIRQTTKNKSCTCCEPFGTSFIDARWRWPGYFASMYALLCSRRSSQEGHPKYLGISFKVFHSTNQQSFLTPLFTHAMVQINENGVMGSMMTIRDRWSVRIEKNWGGASCRLIKWRKNEVLYTWLALTNTWIKCELHDFKNKGTKDGDNTRKQWAVIGRAKTEHWHQQHWENHDVCNVNRRRQCSNTVLATTWERDKGFARLPNNITLSKENTLSFFKDQVHFAIYHALRRYRSYDEYVRTNVVQIPRNIWKFARTTKTWMNWWKWEA